MRASEPDALAEIVQHRPPLPDRRAVRGTTYIHPVGRSRADLQLGHGEVRRMMSYLRNPVSTGSRSSSTCGAAGLAGGQPVPASACATG